ncbi:MAG: exodeoxyribonuclease VII large subunit, partial [Firmicutes bacterium]|nr:exodeoxyribonuclease VII large subunit [Bacillota bacterium]
MPLKPVSVSQLNSYIRRILATDPILMNLSVKGEISNLTKHSAGHWYFTLKDETSRISCFLPRERVSSLRYDISEGMELIVYGSVSVYERGGSYSVYVRDIDVQGEGSLKIAFENLRKKLEAEGLFDPSVKRPIPAFPKRIGVLTSPTGAAVHDIITTVKRRNPLVDVLVYPCTVQGPDAAASIAQGLSEMNRLFPDLDVIIAGRGGGSAEDL